MKIIHDIKKMKLYCRFAARRRQSIGLVPTMGALHRGHESLMRLARKQNDVLVLSVFVNPIQFGENEDFGKYPRPFENDNHIARHCGVDAVFNPGREAMYPNGFASQVRVEGLTDNLCGASRPGHFYGVTTVVAKLFEIVRPDMAYFGQKDAQQAIVVARMVKDLNMDTVIKVMPTVREPDGLAVSSRNAYLGPDERAQAPCLYRALKKAERAYRAGEKKASRLEREMKSAISEARGARIDYAKIVDAATLKEIDLVRGPALAALAVFFGKTRLIDNITLGG